MSPTPSPPLQATHSSNPQATNFLKSACTVQWTKQLAILSEEWNIYSIGISMNHPFSSILSSFLTSFPHPSLILPIPSLFSPLPSFIPFCSRLLPAPPCISPSWSLCLLLSSPPPLHPPPAPALPHCEEPTLLNTGKQKACIGWCKEVGVGLCNLTPACCWWGDNPREVVWMTVATRQYRLDSRSCYRML